MPHRRGKNRPRSNPQASRTSTEASPPSHASETSAFHSTGCNYALLAINGLYKTPSVADLPILREAVLRLDSYLVTLPPLRSKALSVAWDMGRVHASLKKYTDALSTIPDLPQIINPSAPALAPCQYPVLPPGDLSKDSIQAYCERAGFTPISVYPASDDSSSADDSLSNTDHSSSCPSSPAVDLED